MKTLAINQQKHLKITAHAMTIQQTILDWYAQHKRDLPWRSTTDPYHIVVSEFMLQQTQVPRVIPKYHEFLKRFPTIQSLAQASPANVIDAWAGLGYNRRALYLHKFAQAIIKQHNGQIPSDREALLELPGIGPYTSQAIRCFAFKKHAAVVDINIKRIYSRLFFRGAGTEQELQNIARELIPQSHGVEWNNALMDFGSLLCTDNPKCNICPLTVTCTAYKSGTPERYVKPKTQSKFIGSNRFYRSLIIKELRKSENFTCSAAAIQKLKPKNKTNEWFEKIIASLEKDGMITRDVKTVSLPK